MIGIGAFLLCVSGVLLLAGATRAARASDGAVGRGAFQAIGFVLLAVGLLEFLLIYALRDGSNVARIIVTVFVGLNAAGSLLQVLARTPTGVLSWIQLLFDTVILVGLWGTPSASEFFRKDERVLPGPPQAVPPPPPRL